MDIRGYFMEFVDMLPHAAEAFFRLGEGIPALPREGIGPGPRVRVGPGRFFPAFFQTMETLVQGRELRLDAFGFFP